MPEHNITHYQALEEAEEKRKKREEIRQRREKQKMRHIIALSTGLVLNAAYPETAKYATSILPKKIVAKAHYLLRREAATLEDKELAEALESRERLDFGAKILRQERYKAGFSEEETQAAARTMNQEYETYTQLASENKQSNEIKEKTVITAMLNYGTGADENSMLTDLYNHKKGNCEARLKRLLSLIHHVFPNMPVKEQQMISNGIPHTRPLVEIGQKWYALDDGTLQPMDEETIEGTVIRDINTFFYRLMGQSGGEKERLLPYTPNILDHYSSTISDTTTREPAVLPTKNFRRSDNPAGFYTQTVPDDKPNFEITLLDSAAQKPATVEKDPLFFSPSSAEILRTKIDGRARIHHPNYTNLNGDTILRTPFPRTTLETKGFEPIDLKGLHFTGYKIPEFSVLAKRNIEHLKKVTLQFTDVGDQGLAPLRNSTILESFYYTAGPATDFSFLDHQPLKDLQLAQLPIPNLTFLANLTFLEKVEFFSLPQINSLDVLRGKPLKRMILSKIPIRSLSFATGMPLEEVWLESLPFPLDLSPIAQANLKKISIEALKGKTSLDFLQNTPIEELDLNTPIVDPTPIGYLSQSLTKFTYNNKTGIQDFNFITRLEKLKILFVIGLNNPLPDLPSSVDNIAIWYGNINNIHFTRHLQLDTVQLENLPLLTSIEPLRNQPVTQIVIKKTGITDLSPLKARMDTKEIEITVDEDKEVDWTNYRIIPKKK